MNRLGTGAAGQEQAARGQNATGEESCRRECSHWHGAPIRFRRVETVKLAIPSQVYWEFCILHSAFCILSRRKSIDSTAACAKLKLILWQ
jgi:hypothetical protein